MLTIMVGFHACSLSDGDVLLLKTKAFRVGWLRCAEEFYRPSSELGGDPTLHAE